MLERGTTFQAQSSAKRDLILCINIRFILNVSEFFDLELAKSLSQVHHIAKHSVGFVSDGYISKKAKRLLLLS